MKWVISVIIMAKGVKVKTKDYNTIFSLNFYLKMFLAQWLEMVLVTNWFFVTCITLQFRNWGWDGYILMSTCLFINHFFLVQVGLHFAFWGKYWIVFLRLWHIFWGFEFYFIRKAPEHKTYKQLKYNHCFQ